MSKKIASALLAAVVALTATAPVAFAGPRHDGERHHYRDAGRHDHHRGRGHYKNGKWIALGILGAAAAAAAADSDRDCYYRRGHRYCD
jgi:hypothetical protein